MMSSIRVLSSGLLIASAMLAGCVPPKPAAPVPPPVDSETLKKQAAFIKAEALYYDITQQNFQQISCHIDFPTAANMVQQLRTYLETATAGKVSITDTLADYRLTYNKADGLHIEDPAIDVAMKPGTKPVDPAKVELGKAKMEEGFKAMIMGIDTDIHGIVKFEEPSKAEDYDIMYVNLTPDGFQLSMKSKKTGIQETASQTGATYEGKYFSPDGGLLTRTVHSKKLEDGKLLPMDGAEAGSGVSGKTNSTYTITYQVLGGIYFPAKVVNHVTVDSFQVSHQDVTIEYSFSDCRLK